MPDSLLFVIYRCEKRHPLTNYYCFINRNALTLLPVAPNTCGYFNAQGTAGFLQCHPHILTFSKRFILEKILVAIF